MLPALYIVFSQITEKRQKIKDIKEEIKELIVQEKENKAEQRAIKKEYDQIQKELPKLHKKELRFQELQKQIKQSVASDIVLLVFATIPKDVKDASVNMKAPVIVNAANGKAIQVILEKGDYKIKHKIIEDISKE